MLTDFVREMDIDTDELQTILVSPETELHRVYRIKYKKKIRKYPFGFKPARSVNWNDPQRLERLRNIQAFKEAREQKERERLEERQREAEAVQREAARKEKRRLRNAEKLKAAVVQDRERLRSQHEELMKSLECYAEVVGQQEAARRKYLATQQAKLQEFEARKRDLFVGRAAS